MIVKNEEAIIDRCIQSVLPFANEIIINDTGSTDRTLERISQYSGIQLLQSEWKDDFSYSRNLCLENVQSDWVLSIDADETVPNDFGEHVRPYLQKDIDGYLLTLVNHQTEGELITTIPHKLLRLFKSKPAYRFQGTIHEQISPSILHAGGRIEEAALYIDHFGYSEKSEQKYIRNSLLLNQQLKKRPNDPYLWYQLGTMHFGSANFSEAIDAYNSALIYEDAQFPYDTLFTLHIRMAQCFLALTRYKEAEEMIQIALFMDINNPFPYYIRASIGFSIENYTMALENLEKVQRANKGLWKINDYQIEMDFGNAYYKQEMYDRALSYYTEALKQKPNSETACYNLGNCFLKMQMPKEAKEMYTWALTYNPEFQMAKENLGYIDQQLGV